MSYTEPYDIDNRIEARINQAVRHCKIGKVTSKDNTVFAFPHSHGVINLAPHPYPLRNSASDVPVNLGWFSAPGPTIATSNANPARNVDQDRAEDRRHSAIMWER